MHDSEGELNIGQKSAQMGYTETVLNRTFYSIDVQGTDCLYVLPAKTPDASDFSAARFDPALELSAHLSKIFSDVKNVGHKRAGTTNLYIRGSRSRSGLKSVPVGGIVLDEVDEMTAENIPLALERTSGQMQRWIWMVSTPTIENYGINLYFQRSSQNHYHFKCPSCSRWTELTYPESLIITAQQLTDPDIESSHLICKLCKAKLPHETKTDWLSNGKWIESHTGRDSQGWYVNQLYSCGLVTPIHLAKACLTGQIDRAAEQEWYNSKLGVPHAVDGARVTDKQLDDCRCSYMNGEVSPSNLVTMGIDVGSWLHYQINEWILPVTNTSGADLSVLSRCKVVKYGKVRDFEELDTLMHDWKVRYAVIDAQPERRKAKEFADRFYGHVKLAFYPNGIPGKQIHINEEESSVSVDRTSWLDLTLGRFRNQTIMLPADINQEYRIQLKAPVRIYELDKNGNPIGRYVKGNDADHYAHAANYAEIALPLACSLASSYDITGI